MSEVYSQPAEFQGFLLPNGEVLVNYSKGASQETIFKVARVLKAKIIRVQGTLTFTPVAEPVEIVSEVTMETEVIYNAEP